MRTGLTVPQRDALRALARRQVAQVSTGSVAEDIAKDSRATFSVLSALERKGLVTVQDGGDLHWWSLTDRGWERAQR